MPIFGIAFVVACLAGWLTHILTCFATANWGFLLAGAFFVPIGVLHGWWIWFT